MPQVKGNFDSSLVSTQLPERSDVTVYTSDVPCPCCGQLMEARAGKDEIQTNSRGESRVRKAIVYLTCKNADCNIYYQTFDERGIGEIDLSLYLKGRVR
jgi:hypothetical protein